MTYIIGSILIVILVFFFVRRWGHRLGLRWLATMKAGTASVIVAALLVVFGYWGIALTGGFNPNYSNGERTGYLTKLSSRGYIFKTWEGELQLGAGEVAALQAPFQFSVKAGDLVESMDEHLGKRVRVKYRQWTIQPMWMGDTPYEIVEMRVLDDAAQPPLEQPNGKAANAANDSL